MHKIQADAVRPGRDIIALPTVIALWILIITVTIVASPCVAAAKSALQPDAGADERVLIQPLRDEELER